MSNNRIAELRKERGWSAQHLSDECARLGRPIPRSTIASFENLDRKDIRVSELVVICRALQRSPGQVCPDLGSDLSYTAGYVDGIEAARDALAGLAKEVTP